LIASALLAVSGLLVYLGHGDQDINEQASMTLGLSGVRLHSAMPAKIVVGANEISNDHVAAIAIVPFSVANETALAGHHVRLVLQYPAMLRRASLDKIGTKFSIDHPPIVVKMSLVSDGKFDTVSYDIDNLPSHYGLTLEEPFLVQETAFKVETKSVSKDGVNIMMPLSMLLSVVFKVQMFSDNQLILDRDVSIAFVHASSMDEVYRTSTHIVDEDKKKERNATGFLRYLWRIITDPGSKRVFVYYETFQDVISNGASRVVVSVSPPNTMIIDYEVANWGLLLD